MALHNNAGLSVDKINDYNNIIVYTYLHLLCINTACRAINNLYCDWRDGQDKQVSIESDTDCNIWSKGTNSCTSWAKQRPACIILECDTLNTYCTVELIYYSFLISFAPRMVTS